MTRGGARREGSFYAQKTDQPIQAGSSSRAGKNHGMLVMGFAAFGDNFPGRLPQGRHERAAVGSLGMAVGIERQDFVYDEALDGPKSAARGDVVGIDKCFRAERPDDLGVATH